jgi:hypothetical protein
MVIGVNGENQLALRISALIGRQKPDRGAVAVVQIVCALH